MRQGLLWGVVFREQWQGKDFAFEDIGPFRGLGSLANEGVGVLDAKGGFQEVDVQPDRVEPRFGCGLVLLGVVFVDEDR